MTTARMALFLATTLVTANAQAQFCNYNIPVETTPAKRFVIDPAKGTALDKSTGLMWKQCAEGRSGAGCGVGVIQAYTWKDALVQAADSTHAGYKDWRLPNYKELESLVERRCFRPAINLAVFPDTLSNFFWSSSLDISDSSRALLVDFDAGYFGSQLRSQSYPVRLVRNAQ